MQFAAYRSDSCTAHAAYPAVASFFPEAVELRLRKNKRKPREGYRYCGAVHDFHAPALQTLTFSGGEPHHHRPGIPSHAGEPRRAESPGVQLIFGAMGTNCRPLYVIFALTFQNHTNCPLTDFGGKNEYFSHPVLPLSQEV